MRNLWLVFFISWMPFGLLAVEVGDDGLHKQPWLEATFKDIQEDIESALEADKRLMLIVEQRGCPYCKRLHETVLVDPEITSFIENYYFVVQLNLYGSEEVTDLDGEAKSESGIVRKWGIHYTPTILFMPKHAEPNSSAMAQAVAQIKGAADKDTLLSKLHWVKQEGFRGNDTFETFHQQRMTQTQ